jgi:hypothetical protein
MVPDKLLDHNHFMARTLAGSLTGKSVGKN